jgi:hypothetical protein
MSESRIESPHGRAFERELTRLRSAFTAAIAGERDAMKRLFPLAAVLVAGMVQVEGNPLAGSAWELVSIQSMEA